MNKLLFFALYSSLSLLLSAQIPITFDKSINGNNGGKLFEQTNHYEVFLNVGNYARMVTDKYGNEQSIQTYSDTSGFLFNGLRSQDKGYLLMGDRFGYLYPDMAAVYFAYIVKVDSIGTFEWEKTYSFPDFTERETEFFAGESTSDGGYIFAGSECCDSLLSATDWYRPGLYVVKTDSIGNEQWHIMDTTLTDIGFWENTAVAESPLHDGYYIATQYVDSIIELGGGWTRCDKYFLIKTDLQGNYQWTKGYYPLSGYDPMAYYSFKDIMVTDHNTLILLGSNIVMETDLNGNELWRNDHYFGYHAGRVRKVSWGGYIISQGDLIHYIGDDGTIIWEKQYANIASFRDIIPTQDGGFLALIHDPGGRLVKMDCEGNVINPVSCNPMAIENANILDDIVIAYTQTGWTIEQKSTKISSLSLYDVLGNVISYHNFSYCKILVQILPSLRRINGKQSQVQCPVFRP